MPVVICHLCGKAFERPQKRINQVLRNSGIWRCKPCVTVSRNIALSKPLGTQRVKKRGGYIEIKTATGWRFEHVVVMENCIGRAVGRDEVVHHINGIKTDNRIDNLQIMKSSEHTKHHHIGRKRVGAALQNIRSSLLARRSNKLTAESVAQAKHEYVNGKTQGEIAKKLGVARVTVHRAIHGKSWRYINA